MEFLFFRKNVFDETTCNDIIDFMKINENNQSPQYREKGSHSLASVIYLDKKSTPKSYIHKTIYDFLNIIFNNEIGPIMNNILGKRQFRKTNISLKPYQYRIVKGPTRLHSDGSVIVRIGNEFFNRVGTVILTLNDNLDRLVFPAQNKTFLMERNSLIFFPSEWIYPHYTIFSAKQRFSIQTWIYRQVKVNDGSLINIHPQRGIQRTPSFRIIDDLLDSKDFQECHYHFEKCLWHFKKHPSYGLVWIKDLSKARFFTTFILFKIMKAFDMNFKLKNCYGIGQTFGTGDDTFISEDSNIMTIVLHLGQLHHSTLVGYLGATELQYNLDLFVTSILFKPNRCVLFSNNIPHRETCPGRSLGILKTLIYFEVVL